MVGRFLMWNVLMLTLCAVFAAAGCDARHGSSPAASPRRGGAEPIRVVVSIPPLHGLVTPLLAGMDSKVETLIPVGVSEHGYEIPASKLAALAKADIVVYVGRGLEPQVSKFLAEHPSDSREVVQFAALILDNAGRGEGTGKAPGTNTTENAEKDVHASEHSEHAHDEHDDHDGHHHDHENDPHLWLDPSNVKLLIPGVRKAIERLLESRGGLTEAARSQLETAQAATLLRVGEIDDAYTKALAKATSRTIVVAHNAYEMLAKRYGLTTVAIAGLNASEPTMQDIRLAIEAVKSQGAKVVFVEPQLSRSASDKVAQATGAMVLVLDPVGGEDWFVTMSRNLDSLAKGLGVARE